MTRPAGGVLIAIAVFVSWGLFPSFFKLLSGVPATEILAHRILWSSIFMAGLVAVGGHLGALRAILASPRTALLLTLSATLIAVNWLTYVDAVTADHVLEASLGYFASPLATVALGRLVLGEKLTRLQLLACVLAAIAVASFALGTGTAVWRSLVLAGSFGCYGLVRKLVPVEALPGFAVECFVLAPVAGLYLLVLWLAGTQHMSLAAPALGIELVLSGVITAVPLIGYSAAARRMRLSTLGLLQYITPSIQFVLGTLVYGEDFDLARLAGFAVIWLALALYSVESLRIKNSA
jgi:chloramphenicol-sensitive protein RarD